MKQRTAILPLAGAILIGGLGGLGAATPHMTAAELRALAPGTYFGIWKDKYKGIVTVSPDGSLKGKSGIFSDRGRWELKGDAICFRFRWWTWNKPQCGLVRRTGNDGWYHGIFRTNGEPRVRFRKKQ